MTNVRVAAARVLLGLDDRPTTLADGIEAAREGLDDRRDRGLLIELASGTLRWRAEIDAVIAAAGRRRATTIDPPVLAVLRLGAYQLRHLDRVPAHAVVHESVEAVRALGVPRAAAFVNAVLRGIVRRGAAIALPKRPEPGAPATAAERYLSITLSHPAWLVRRWIARYGFEAAEAWCLFNNRAPDISIRGLRRGGQTALLERLEAEGIPAEPSPYVNDAMRLPPGALGRISPELAAEIQVQDEGAQLVARYVAARPGERVIDLCAAPGGKTLVLASDLRLGDNAAAASQLVASDRRPARVALLVRTLARAGLDVPVVALDALGPLPFGAVFDCVLLDAPCSGLGTLRRDPDLKWSRREADLPRLAAEEARMLDEASALVAPGGRLVYATCSSEPEENIELVRAFLEAHPGFSLREVLPPTIPAALASADGCLTTTPFQHGLDAFFAAALVRRTAT
jgi:16S rRNA (cytosine967-C5)-methyltransferase